MTLRLKTRLTLTITTLVLVVLSIVSLFTIITFTREQIRRGLPEPKAFGLADLRCCVGGAS